MSPPRRTSGPHVRRLGGSPAQIAALQSLLEASPGYFRRLTGSGPGPRAARELFDTLPPGKTSEDKYLLGLVLDGQLIGCVDLIRRYPDERTAFIGLLLIAESHQRRGFGRFACGYVETLAGRWPECRGLRLAVAEPNAGVLPFWEGLGFRTSGERKSAAHGGAPFVVWLMDKEMEAGTTFASTSMGVSSTKRATFPEEIEQYRRVSHRIATAGQPTARQLAALAPAGFDVVINLLPSGSRTALNDEAEIVRSLGLTYVHIPVAKSKPSAEDLTAFCDCLDEHHGRTILVHSSANRRASVFTALYRILRLGWQPDRALRDVHRVWQPDAAWRAFIRRTLKSIGPGPAAL